MKNNHYIEKIRQQKPLIHAITNTVTIHDMADSLIAVGASPMMAVERREVGELQTFSQALVLNTGTLTAERVEVMLEAGRAANRHQVPIILDPVGAGATNFRSQAVHQLLAGLDTSPSSKATPERSLIWPGRTGRAGVSMPAAGQRIWTKRLEKSPGTTTAWLV